MLGNVATLIMGQSPSSEYVGEEEVGISFLQGNAEFGDLIPKPKLFCSKPQKVCEAGDILMSVRAPVGALNKADRPYCIGRGLAGVRFNKIPKEYGWHLLGYFAPQLQRVAQGTTFEAIGRKELQDLAFKLCEPSECKFVAEILDGCDELISCTDNKIQKLQKLKDGLLHDLLTRGIGEDGKLRDPLAHPEQFKESELGRIPNEWIIRPLQNVILSHQAGIYKNRELFGSGSNIVGVSDLYRETSINGQEFRRVPLSEIEQQTFTLKEGDLIYGESSLVLDGIAQTLWVTKRGEGTAFSWHTRRLSLRKESIDSQYLYYQLGSVPARRRIMAVANQTALTGITTKGFFGISILLPPVSEQKKIAGIFAQVDSMLQMERSVIEKASMIKQGLMHDLLTGTVRTTPLLTKAA